MKETDSWIEEHEMLMAVLEQAIEELKKYPGMVSVEIGIKETEGDLTQELSFRVYMSKKLPEDQLTPDQMIPEEFMGFTTDVIEHDLPSLTMDAGKYRPLKGGIQIDNEEPAGAGTLGCIGRVFGTNELVVLTNAHVVQSGGRLGFYRDGTADIPELLLLRLR